MAIEGNPMIGGSIFLRTGVQDQGTIATLAALNTAFDRSTNHAIAFANQLDRIVGSLAAMGAIRSLPPTFAGGAPAFAPAGGGRGGAPLAPGVAPVGGGGRAPRGGMLPVGVRYLGAYAGIFAGIHTVQESVAAEQEALRAAFAAAPPGTSPFAAARLAPGLRREGTALSRRFRLGGVQPGVSLVKEISQLGGAAASNPAARRALAEAAISLSLLSPETTPEQNAAILFRLAQSTGTPLTSAVALGSGIARAGERSAAGPGGIIKFVQALQSQGVISNASPQQIIALAGALSTIDEARPETFSTAITRLGSKTFQNSAQAADFAQYIGISKAEFQQLASTNPVELVARLAERVGQGGGTIPGAVLTGLGINNARDIRTLASFAPATDIFRELVGSDPALQDRSLMGRTAVLLETMGFQFKGLATETKVFADSIVRFLAPALSTAAVTAAGILGVINDNPLLTGLAIAGGGALLGRGLGRFATKRGGGFLGGAANIASLALLAPFRPFRGAAAAFRGARVGRAGGLAVGEAAALGGLFGGRGLTSRFGAQIGARSVGFLAGRSALGLAGPIGLGIGALSLLEPVFNSLSNMFEALGNRSGVIGAVFGGMGRLFSLIAGAGGLINKGFDAIGDFLSPVWDAINKGVDKFRGTEFGSFLFGEPAPKGAKSDTTAAAPTPTVSVGTVNIGEDSGFTNFLDRALRQTAGGL